MNYLEVFLLRRLSKVIILDLRLPDRHPFRRRFFTRHFLASSPRMRVGGRPRRISIRVFLCFRVYLLRFLMLSACGDFMYSSTICFHRRRHSQPRKKLCTFLILRSSSSSFSGPTRLVCFTTTGRHSRFNAHSWNRKRTRRFLLIFGLYWNRELGKMESSRLELSVS